MPTTKARAKAGKRRERGVYVRKDGRPRFELKIRWTNADGSAGYTPTRVFPFDPDAKGGPTCRAHALDSANKLAIEERVVLRLHDKPRARLAEALALGAPLEQLTKELGAQVAKVEADDVKVGTKTATKHIRQKNFIRADVNRKV